MKRFTISRACAILAVFLCISYYSKANHLSDRLTFSARMQPAAGVNSHGNGVAAFMLTSARDTMYFTTSFARLSSALTGYHIHNARTGGNVVVDFAGKIDGNTVKSFITGTQLSTLLPDFIAGNLYVAAHTTNYPSVEIMGSVKLESDWGFFATLDGAQAGTNSPGTGLAVINFDLSGDTVEARVVTNLTNKLTSVRLYAGKPGQTGPSLLQLEGMINPDSVHLHNGRYINALEWTGLMAALMNDSVYIMLHTYAFVNGEIRGQLRTSNNLRFDAWLDQAASIVGGQPASKFSTAHGVGTMWLNHAMDTFKYDFFFREMSSNVTAAHFHSGQADAMGPVIKNATVTGTTISGTWTKYDATQPLTNSAVSMLLSGGIYFNIHTDSNPAGEIRGQVYRLAREGLIAELDGQQAGMAVRGQGSAVVSYDRDRMDLHYMVVYDTLSSNLSNAWMRKAVKGQNGPFIFDLGAPTNNGFYGFWTSKAGFSSVHSAPFETNDSVYINLQTGNFTNGELRGQLMRNYRISAQSMTPPPQIPPDFLSDRVTFAARMMAAPGVTTSGNGVGAFMMNSTWDTLYFTISWAKLSSALTGIHIHNARTGGNIVVDFDSVQGNTIKSYMAGSRLSSLRNDLIAGNLYVAAHTTTNPAAEILGTIKLEKDWSFSAFLDSAQAGTTTGAKGYGVINFGMAGDTATVRVVTSMSNKITSAHIHWGKAGQSGGVALGFNSIIGPDSVSLFGGVSITPAAWTNIMAALLSDSIYINLHSAAFPAGEIRGQLKTSKTLRFDIWLNQEGAFRAGSIGPISKGYGVGALWLNANMDSMWAEIQYANLFGIFSLAHFHLGDIYSNGPVVKDLSISGPHTLSAIWTNTGGAQLLTPTLFRELLKGNIYVNIHTSTHPNGEIRGQVLRTAREGYIAELNGAQAGTTTTGMGTGVATYDRDLTNLHTMMSFDNVGTVTAAHIHSGLRGQSGGVMIDLAPVTNNSSEKYSKVGDGFNHSALIAMSKNDSSYINVHTSAFANGEIRGQLMRYYRPSANTIVLPPGIASAYLAKGSSVSLYPNPVRDMMTIALNTVVPAKATIVLYDLSGRAVHMQSSDMPAGNNAIDINTNILPCGFYVAELRLDSGTATHVKFVKE